MRTSDLILQTAHHNELAPIHESFPTRYLVAYRKELEYFALMVREGAPPVVSRETVLYTS